MSKKKKDQKVNKAMGPEEMTLLENALTILEEVKTMNNAGAEQPKEEIEMADDGVKDEDERGLDTDLEEEEKKVEGQEEEEEEKEEDDVDVIVKGKVAKEADVTSTPEGATASDDADKRIEEPQTEETQQNKDEVAKSAEMFMKVLQNLSIPKQAKPVNPVLKCMADVVDRLKEMKDESSANSQAIKHMLDAQGVTKSMDSMEKNIVKKQKKDNPTMSMNVTASQLGELVNAVNKSQGVPVGAPVQEKTNLHPSTGVQKNLANVDVLSALVVKK